ncbi:InlB B-repeat-containing protein, partial [Parabacteroides goldsteinii]|uniref:InlB B-repeat-containing protein n=1 Tax=Parabacteroides goldsteinii TaxID=328812 RepID=UPI0025B70DD1
MRGLRRSKRWLAMLLAFTLAFSNVAYLDTPMVTYAAEETPDEASSKEEETAAEDDSEEEADTEQEETVPEESSDSQETTEEPPVEEEPEQPSVEEEPIEPVEGNPEEEIPDTDIIEEPTEEEPDEVIEEEVTEQEEKEEDEKPATYEVTFKASGDYGTVKVRMPDSEEYEKIGLNKGFSGTVEEDSTVTFSVQADEGYSIDKVEVNTERKYADSEDGDVYIYELENIDSEKNVKIFFVEDEPEEEVEEEPTEEEEDPELESYELTVSVPEVNGTVTVTTPEAKKADASKGYSVTVKEGSKVSLNVAPDEGYEIDSVSVNGKNADASTETEESSTYEIAEIKEDITVTVTFAETEAEEDPALEELNEYEVIVDVLEGKGTVEVTTSEGGTVDASEGYSETVKEGSTISLEVEPEKGYKGVVKVNGKTVKATSKSLKRAVYAVKEITSDIIIEVNFVEEADASLMPKQELTAEAGGVTVTVKAEAGVLPEGTKVVAKEVSSSKVEDVIAETLEEDKEIVRTTAIDVTLQDQNGNEVQPAEGRNVVVGFSGISTDGEADSMAVYHVDDAGESADKVTGDRAVSDSVVFTAGHFSIYSVVQKGDITTGRQNYQMTVGDTLVIESGMQKWGVLWQQSPSWKSDDTKVITVTGDYDSQSKQSKGTITAHNTGTATVTVTGENNKEKSYQIEVVEEVEGVYPLYFYGLKPGGNKDDKDVNSNWYGLGVGSISGVKTAPVAGKVLNKEGDYTSISMPNNFPDIVYGEKVYKCAETSENANKEGYYTISWGDVTGSNGANSGINNYNLTTNKLCFHLDGVISINQSDKVTVIFNVKNPDDNNFTPIVDASRTVDVGTKESTIEQPVPESKEGYTFDGWYREEACTNKVAFSDDVINVNTNYYGRYVADSYAYSVEYYYDGIKDDDATEEGLTAELGSQVSDYTPKPKDGYKLQSDPKPITITENVNDNVLKVYYVTDEEQTKDLSFTVEYYKDNVKVDGSDLLFEEKGVQVLQPSTMEVDWDQIDTRDDKYYGYTLDSVSVDVGT